jgi:hypothetical protein
MASVMLQIEGVMTRIRDSRGEDGLIQSTPIEIGLKLFHSLRTSNPIILVSNDTVEHTDYWLKTQGIGKDHYALLMTPQPVDRSEPLAEVPLRQLDRLMGMGHNLGLLISADPYVVKEAVKKGVPSLLFAHPTYARPEWRPEHSPGMRAWAEIEEEQTENLVKLALDERLER